MYTSLDYTDNLQQARNEHRAHRLQEAHRLYPGLGDAAAFDTMRQNEKARTPSHVADYVAREEIPSLFGIPLTLRKDNLYKKEDITKFVVISTILIAIAIIIGLGIILAAVSLCI